MKDYQYFHDFSQTSGQRHDYGPGVHLLGNAYYFSLLSRIGTKECKSPAVHQYVSYCYQGLMNYFLSELFPRKEFASPTRMFELTPKGVFHGIGLDLSQEIVVVDIARAGTYPAQLCYEQLTWIFPSDQIRQDHIYINRVVDAQGQVVGNDLSGSKIGGSVEGKILLIPDPMGATGGTIDQIVKHYHDKGCGSPSMILALHLMITPEYLRRREKNFPHVQVIGLRLDRGLSEEHVLEKTPGAQISAERGLNDHQYLVPGAGGMGEVLNNSWV
jgi:uracil phosphoribosyltransferase